jgi:hypothetical protein
MQHYNELFSAMSLLNTTYLFMVVGSATAQVVSCRLPTVAAWDRAQVRSCGFVVAKVELGKVFFRVFRFPLPIFIPLTAQNSS